MTEPVPTTSNGEPKGPPQACLFVANLQPPEVGEERIREHFGQFGEVLKVKLIKDRSSRPYAFVQFSDVDDATEALKSNKLFDGKRLRVERAKVNRTLFIAKLSRNTTNSGLREQAQKFGPVESVTIIKNHQTNKSKGCGFVKYSYREDAMDAFVGLKNVNHKWVVEWATSTNDPDTLGVDKYNIFIGGLNPDEVTKEAIEAKFVEYGEIESASVINKEDGADGSEEPPSPGPRSAFAFVRYTDPSSSAAAIEAENGVEWLGRRIRVQYCESAEMKNKRRQTKYAQQTQPQPPYAPPPLPVPPPHQFYGAHPSAQSLEPPRPPIMMMGGPLPMYNIPSMSASLAKPGYGARGKVYPTMTPTYPLNPALLAYAQQPWLFAQLQQQMPQQPIHPLHPLHTQFTPTRPIQHIPHHQHSPHAPHSPSHIHQPQPQHQPLHHQPNHSHASHTGRPLHSLQRNRGDGASSPNSDDSIGLEDVTQSITGWVLNK
jgi:RNA recognition motif-containing protein